MSRYSVDLLAVYVGQASARHSVILSTVLVAWMLCWNFVLQLCVFNRNWKVMTDSWIFEDHSFKVSPTIIYLLLPGG